MSLKKDFADTLRGLLNDYDMSQTELSKKTGVTNATISNILSGKMEPSFTMCERLMKAFGETLELSFSLSGKKSA